MRPDLAGLLRARLLSETDETMYSLFHQLSRWIGDARRRGKVQPSPKRQHGEGLTGQSCTRDCSGNPGWERGKDCQVNHVLMIRLAVRLDAGLLGAKCAT